MDLVYVCVAIPKDKLERLLEKTHTNSKKAAILKAVNYYLEVVE